MPHKANAGRRHHIPRPKRRVTNWAEYDTALRRRGSLTVWFTEEAIASWRAAPRTTPGGQPHYSALAIMTALMLRAASSCRFRITPPSAGGPEPSSCQLDLARVASRCICWWTARD